MPLTGSYTNDVQYLIEMAENASLANDPNATNIAVEVDSKGRPFIGYGFDLLSYKSDPAAAVAALTAAGAVIVDADQLTNLIQNEIPPINEGELDLIAGSVYLPNQASAVALLTNSIAAAESDLDTFTQGLGIGVIPQSNERAALVDMWYQLPGGGGINGYFINGNNTPTQLSQALLSGNRAEAWFQIRYGSADNGNNGNGVVRRRYVDSQLFGLYADPSAPTETEALQAYQMLTANRSTIMDYELRFGSDPYGSDPYGTDAPSSQIAAANSDYGLTGTANEVQTLAAAFDAAAGEEIRYLKGQYGSVLPDIEVNDIGGGAGSSFDVRSVDFYAASSTDLDVDAKVSYALPAESDDVGNHILLGSETGDTLVGALGSDILVAQAGNERLESGAGSDTLIASGGNDTIQAEGVSSVMDFVFPNSSGYDETVEMNAGSSGLGALYVNGSQIGGDLSAGSSPNIWTANGNTYTFVSNPSNPPPGYSPATGGSNVGELQILMGGTGGNEIDIWGFNLSDAESATGYLGIDIPPGLSVVNGSTDGIDPPAGNFVAGSAQSYTVSTTVPSTSAQTITMTLSGAPASDFGLVSGATIVPLNSDGTFTITIPAGETSASFSLVNTGDVGSGATLQFTASMVDPNDQNDTVSSTPLTQNYIEPAQDPFQAPLVPELYYYGATTVNGAIVGTYRDVQDGGATPVASIGGGSAFINFDGEGGESINGGAGSDTMVGAFVTPENVNDGVGQVSVINANDAQDIIAIGDALSGYQSQIPPVAIYGNSEEDLTQAVSDAEDGTATLEQGDLISTSTDDSTIVGGNGNDLIMSASNGVIVAGPGDDTIAGGGSLDYTNSLMGATWSASVTGNQLSLSDGMSLETSATTYSYSNYEGNFDSSGYALGTSNQTIFGGAGNDVILLSNGDNAVNLGSGDSTVFGGMGSNTIAGGSGSDSIVGGGGSDYIEAGSGNDFVAGYGGNNTIFGGSGTDTLFAGDGDSDWATEETGDNYVQAGSGNSLIYGSDGNDTLLGGSGADTINAGDGNESIVAGSGDTSINGGNGPDTIVAGTGSDTIWGSTESTTIYGGTGSDDILGTTGTDVIYAGDGGTSQAPTSITAGSGDTTIYGGGGVDQIWGGDGNDVIYAGDGGAAQAATQVFAGAGDTTIYGGDGTDNIMGGSGTDVLYAGDGGSEGSPSYVTAGTGTATLYGGAGVSVLTDAQGGNDVLEAGSGDTSLYGVGQDTLIAGSGTTYLAGGPGSTYVFGSNVSVDEVASAGSGTLEFTSSVDSSDISLSAVLDSGGAGSLTIDEGDGSITVDGALSDANEIGSVVFDDPQSLSLMQFVQQEASLGNAAATTVAGVHGNLIFDVANGDVVSGGSGQDTISAWGNNDTLNAGSGGGEICAEGTDDLVTGGSGNDTLDAAAAGTTLVGGLGNEVFEVNDSSDVVEGQANANSNAIVSYVNYTLPTHVDVLTLAGTENLSATGNSDAGNVITGNAGNDTLIAGSGSDTLISGTGIDTLLGGNGPDTFMVNNSADVIEPASNQGWHDTVESSVSFELTASVATLDLVGSGDLSVRADHSSTEITGNTSNDTLIGESGFDTFVGGAGVDTFEAGGDNNVFVVNNADDVIQLDFGMNDTLESSVSYTLGQGVDALMLTGAENLQGQGNADASNLIEGNSGNDMLVAGSGSDTLVAGSGSDTLVAGVGTDVLEGGTGTTTYLLNSGFGSAEIQPGSGSGVIEFGSGITPSDLTVGLTTDSDGNAALLIQDGSSAVTIDGGLAGSINDYALADGTTLTLEQFLTEANVTSETIAGAAGTAVLSASADVSLSGGGGNDTLVGAGTSDTIVAGTGNQQLVGAASDDVLVGGVGDDTMFGGVGNDTFVSGTGSAVIHGGDLSDTLLLTQGAGVTFYPSNGSGIELIELPENMTLADFTSYLGPDGDLIVQSLSGDTTAVIKGFSSSGSTGKTWMIADSSGSIQLLSAWVDSQHTAQSGYEAEVAELAQEFGANLTATLQQMGKQGGSISDPSNSVTSGPQDQYQFNGISTQSSTVQGGTLNLGSSDDDQSTYTSLQTGSTTYDETVPVYSEVTVPGSQQFVADSSLSPADLVNMQNAVGSTNYGVSVETGTDASGDQGYWITTLPHTETVQTGTKTVLETVPEYSNYTQETQSFTEQNVTGDGGNDVITSSGPFVGSVVTGNGNVFVDLGMANDAPWAGHLTYDYPDPLSPGAFIEAGSGVDTINGTGGADVIAAGFGIDYIDAGLGSTVYVPLEGFASDEITTQAPFYGHGPFPKSTLVLPQGVTPADLSYRLIDDWNFNADPLSRTMDEGTGGPENWPTEVLQITYGDSSVLIDFNSASSLGVGVAAGISQFQFSDGTVLSRDQLIAMAGPAVSASSFNPIVTALDPTVDSKATIAGESLFSASDSSGSNVTWYQISNTGAGGGYFTANGAVQAPGQTFYVSAGQLPELSYVAGSAGSTDSIQVAAFDGVVWGEATSFSVNPLAAIAQATGPDQEVNGSSTGPDTLIGGYGGDTLVGSSGLDTFDYSSGGGAEVISETAPSSASSANAVQFGPGITASSLSLSAAAVNSELVLSIAGSGDSVAIEGFNALNPLQSFPIQSFSFSGGTDLTLLQLLSDSAVTGTSGSITNPDGTTTDYQFTPSGDQIYSAQNVNSAGQWLETVSVNADGSDTTSSYSYNADGSETETEVLTPAAGGGGPTTKVLDINSQGQTTSVDTTNPDGSTDDSAYTYNPDGSMVQTEVETPAGGGAPTTIVYDLNSQWQTTAMDITNPDGSTSDRTYVYNADGSEIETDVDTPAGGGGATTTVYDINSQRQRTSIDITNPDGSTDDSSYVFNPDGSVVETEVVTPVGGGGATTTVYDINSQNQWTSVDVTNPDGSTVDTAYTYNADGSETETEVAAPAGGGSATTSVYDYAADGTLLNYNAYTPGSDGSYHDNWSSADGSYGSYWWNSSTLEYQEFWSDSNGNSFTDDYQYASGGSPGAAGYSFVESYSGSDGSSGTRQYDASTGAVSLSWDSASTGQLSGTITDPGFIGLQNDGELTNTQQDLTFFNPNVSSSFSAFLAAH